MILDIQIEEIRKTTSEKEANFLISDGWKLVHVMPIGTNYQYLLVKES